MKIVCPDCRTTVPAENVALDSGWAKCLRCQKTFEVASVVPGFRPATHKQGHPPAAKERPFDAWAIVERADRKLLLHVPAQGMRLFSWILLALAVFNFGFMTVWTAGALRPFWEGQGAIQAFSVAMALTSLPGWATGFWMIGLAIWLAWGTRTVYLDQSHFYTELRCLFWRRRWILSRELVQRARKGVYRLRADDGQQMPVPWQPVEIVHRGGKFRVFCRNESERNWLVAQINDFLQSVPYAPRADTSTLKEEISRQIEARFFPRGTQHA